MVVLKVIFIALILISVVSPTYAELVLARAPQLSPSILAKIWTPYVNYLSEETGEKITLKLYSERSKFESDIVKENIDLYFGNPAYAVIGKLSKGYIPLVRGDKKRLKGIIVTRVDSGINSVEDLRNKVIVFPGNTAFAASLYIRDQLTNHLQIPFKEAFVNTHDNGYRSVLAGKYVASGGVRRTLGREPESLKNKLKVIYETPGVKPHVLVVHPRVPKNIQEKLLKATINLTKTEVGKAMLKKIKLVDPVRANYKEDYMQLEELAVKVYDHLL